MTPGKRIKEIRKSLGLTQAELAERCGWEGAGRVSNYENESRNPKADDIAVLSKALKVDRAWLQFGGGIAPTSMVDVQARLPEGKVPVIGWDEVMRWIDFSQEAYVSDWEYALSPEPTNKTLFALKVKTDSMIGKPKSFNPGSLIFVDPMVAPSDGKYVVVIKNDAAEPIFRQWTQEGGKTFLKPLNPAYKMEPMDTSYKVCGVVIEHRDSLA